MEWSMEDTFALVELANALGVQLNPKETNAQALRACTNRAKQLVAALDELQRVVKGNP